ncbi:MAG: hypothetical protein NWE93_13575 [Candidatus Bathyarchaeota archaeon]|nr:hypothetical protein [Candidatus Bathyarchaeota archaeon]
MFALFCVPWGNGETVTLEARYMLGEEFAYSLTATSTSQTGNQTLSTSSHSILTVEVLDITPDTYILNYTLTPNAADAAPTSQTLEVNCADAINLYTLMPAALLPYTQSINCSSPIETALLSQREAKFGDSLQAPVICAVTGTPDAEITLKLTEGKDVDVEAGKFRVFRLEFAQTQQSQGGCKQDYGGVLGWALLERGSGKQIRSLLEFNMTAPTGFAVTTFQSILLKDELR